ncbi:GEVED domain-containing protein [Adhaeribacter pallidiroseus]|nr:GEVED domain-containing protein [Adhaeribacter pallidiroseus]
MAQLKLTAPEEYTYYRNGKKVRLTPQTDEVYVTYSSKVNLATGKMQAAKLQNQVTKVEPRDVFAPLNAVRYRLNSRNKALSISGQAITNQFTSNPEVITAYPAFKIGKDKVYLGNKITYVLKKDSNKEKVNAFLKNNKSAVVEKIDLGDRIMYVVAIEKGGSVFKIANGLYENGLVEYAEPDFSFSGRSHYLPNDPFFTSQWFLHQESDADIDAPEAWDITTGSSSVVVAVMDGHGYDLAHPDLEGKIVNPYDAYNDSNTPFPQNEFANHGTPCAGIIAAATHNRKGGASVGNNIKVMPVSMGHDVRDGSNGDGDWSTNSISIARAAAKIIATPGVVAVSNSYNFNSSDFAAAVEVSFNAMCYNSRGGLGAVILASTGNNGQPNAKFYPAAYDVVVGVGSSNNYDTRTPSSNYGGYTDIVAPGTNILTLDRSGPPGKSSDDYMLFDGTSAACPVAAAVVGLTASLRPEYGVMQHTIALLKSAEKVGGYTYYPAAGHPYGTWNNEMGHGRVNVHRALQFIQGLPQVYGFSPAGGPVGTKVTITGKSFLGASLVTFNGVSAEFSVLNETTILATSPAGGTSGYIQVSNAAGTGTSPKQWSLSAYCTPLYEMPCATGDYINLFGLNTLLNLNSGCNGQTANYINYEPIGAHTTNLSRGKSYSISMQGGPNLSQGFGVWLDYNNDGDFNDTGEFIYKSPGAGKNVFSGTITIPANAPTGLRRLRVRTKYYAVPAANESCTTFNTGETEDYTVAIGYCVPTLNCQLGNYINNFSFNTLAHNNSGCEGIIGGYSNFPPSGTLTTTVAKGQRYTLKVQSGTLPQGFGVWIDYNNDQNFDANEFVYGSPIGTELYSATVTIPTNVSTGLRRMRVMSKYNTLVTGTDACTDFANGEVEDYTITIANGGVASTEWNKRFGGTGNDLLSIAIKTADGGYLLGGQSDSDISGDKSQSNLGAYDYWIVKTDAAGNKQWEKRYGGSGRDNLNALVQTSDGGYLLGGNSLSGISGDKSQASRGGRDYWVIKISNTGTKQWDKRFGGSGDEDLKVILPLANGEYLLAGFSLSGAGGDKTQASKGGQDFWVVKLNSTGGKLWDKSFGGNSDDILNAAITTTDGGFLIGGGSASGASGDKTQATRGARDYWVVKLNANGAKQWDKRFGGSLDDDLQALTRTADNNFLLGGISASAANGDRSQTSQGGNDFWIVKINSDGTKLWDKRFGGSSSDELKSITTTSDGGYLLGGRSNSSNNGDKSQGSQGSYDYWIVKINTTGGKQWDKRYGGNAEEDLRTVFPTSDGGYVLAGRSVSGISGDKTQVSQGGTDFWLVKVPLVSIVLTYPVDSTPAADAAKVVESETEPIKAKLSLNTYPNPFRDKLTVDFTPEKTGQATIKVYDSQGTEVKTLLQGEVEAGKKYELSWQLTSEKDGIYIIRLSTAGAVTATKVILIK